MADKWQHPFHQGFDARIMGKLENDNPYTEEPWQSAWYHGWDEADAAEELAREQAREAPRIDKRDEED